MTRRILVAKEKHGDYYYPADTKEELYASALALVTERLAADYFYFDQDQELARKIVDEKKGQAAWNFLQDRSDGEYEYVSLENLEMVKLDGV